MFDDTARQIWNRQYPLTPGETLEEGLTRTASVTRDAALRARIAEAMLEKRFCAGGRVIAGAGSGHRNTLNCFRVQSDTERYDSLDDVENVALKNALITKVGGGTGETLAAFSPRSQACPPQEPARIGVYLDPRHPDHAAFQAWTYHDATRPEGQQQVSPPRRAVELAQGLAGHDVVVAVPDSMEGIIRAAFQMLRHAARGLRVAVDLSGLRRAGEGIRGSGGTASGPASFATEVFDNFAHWYNLGGHTAGPVAYLRYVAAPIKRVTKQGGVRRGAGMATLPIDHEDWEDFLSCKDPEREALEGDISTYNISFLVPDAFARAARQPWTEEGARMKAVAQHAWGSGEPGIIFVDTLNRYNILQKTHGDILSTNPCGEIGLYSGEPCDLGAINLAAYVWPNVDLVSGKAVGQFFDEEGFWRDFGDYLDYLDDNLDYSGHAIDDTRRMSLRNRRLGLGVMGLADALVKLGLRYGSPEAQAWTENLFSRMSEAALIHTERMALEKGEPEWSVQARQAGLIERPRRNVAALTVAPTGTTSMLMGVSSGIEPIFSPFIWRKVGADYLAIVHPLFRELLKTHTPPEELSMSDLDAGGALVWDWDAVTDALQEGHGSVQDLPWVPDEIKRVFVCAHDVSPEEHVRMQGAVQRGMDAVVGIGNSCSKTINLPNSATVQDVLDAYLLAWEVGCKGITVYRDGSRQFQVLSTAKTEGEAGVQAELDAGCATGSCEK